MEWCFCPGMHETSRIGCWWTTYPLRRLDEGVGRRPELLNSPVQSSLLSPTLSSTPSWSPEHPPGPVPTPDRAFRIAPELLILRTCRRNKGRRGWVSKNLPTRFLNLSEPGDLEYLNTLGETRLPVPGGTYQVDPSVLYIDMLLSRQIPCNPDSSV